MRSIGMATGKMVFGHTDRIVIVGGGPAGWAAAEELRKHNFAGEVVVICDEAEAPYDRTACSKGLLNGHQKPRDIALDTRRCPDVTWSLGRRATRLDAADRRVVLDTGESVSYDGLVIATGARPVLPDQWPTNEPGLHVLHGVHDAWAIRKELRDARRVAVVGGGLTGSEVACTVRGLAREALIVNSQPVLMSRVLGDPAGALITVEHRSAGVETRLGRRVVSVDRGRGRWRLRLDDGEDVHADLVVAAAGDRPDVDWLVDSPLDTTDGVLCDETLRAVGCDGVVAAGVVARWPNLRYSTQPRRIGHWIAAIEQGQGAARTLLFGDGVPPVTVLPRFWSNQLGLRIQVCGQIGPDAEIALTEMRPGRRDIARSGVMASYYRHGRLCGVAAVNAPQAFTVASRTLQASPAVDAAGDAGQVAVLRRRAHSAV